MTPYKSSKDMTDSELRKEIRKIYNNLSKRVSNLRGVENAPLYAINKYEELADKMPHNLRYTNRKELLDLYREAKYTEDLESSSVKGAIFTRDVYEPIKQMLNPLSEEKQKEFWDAYLKFYHETGGTGERFKYELFYANIDYIYGGKTAEEILNDTIQAFIQAKVETRDLSDEELELAFADKLTEGITRGLDDVQRKQLFTTKLDEISDKIARYNARRYSADKKG